MICHPLLLPLLLTLLWAGSALALDYKQGAIEIRQPWTRATPPTANQAAASWCSPIPARRPIA